MRAWQRLMIRLARSERARQIVQQGALTKRLAGRFVGGEDLAAAVRTVRALRETGIRASLYFLGEYLHTPRLVEENVNEIIAAVRTLDASGLDVHVSIDPTQIGFALSDEVGIGNARLIGKTVARHAHGPNDCLMLDMEDFDLVERTLELHSRLRSERIPAAVTVQAYLRRSEQDLRSLIAQGAHVRLVTGAFAENRERAFTRRSEVYGSFLHLAELLLSPDAEEKGVFASFATHNHRLVAAASEMMRSRPRPREMSEFEMLYGVRPALQRRLVEQGHQLRLYLPFGTEWWPYTARRLGERPANVLFALPALLGR